MVRRIEGVGKVSLGPGVHETFRRGRSVHGEEQWLVRALIMGAAEEQ